MMVEAISMTPANRERRRVHIGGALGAGSGAGATLLFLVVHHVAIMPIWFMAMPMLIAGAICGAAIAWSFPKTTHAPSIRTWAVFNGAYLVSLLALGIVSLLGFEPAWTFAELNVESPPLGDLFARAMPLMVAFSMIAAVPIWAAFGRRWESLVPILVTETLLVLLLGHNVAIIGLVDLTAEGWALLWLMFGLVAFLAVAYAVLAAALNSFVHRRRQLSTDRR
jgi:hypothetical protein